MGVVAGLVLGGGFCSICRDLLQDGSSPHGGGRTSLVEEGDDVEGFVLFTVASAVLSFIGMDEQLCLAHFPGAYKSKHGYNWLSNFFTRGS
jgi:hypothetical protein